MTDLEKHKLLAEIDKYEHELATLEGMKDSVYGLVDVINLQIMQAEQKIEMCKQNLREVEDKWKLI